MDNPILTEHETNEMYKVYKSVKEKVETIKASYVDLSKKCDALSETYEKEKIKLNEVVTSISEEKLAWATEKADELRVIENMKAEAKKILDLKGDLESKEQAINTKIEKNTEILNEKRRLELKLKDDQLQIDNTKKEVETIKKETEKIVTDYENGRKSFKEKITSLINEF